MEQNFEKLDAWKKAKELCLLCYKISQRFPKEENFALLNQIRRAAISVPSNIAEGYSRRTVNDLCHFLDIAIGSVFEIMTQANIACELDYIKLNEKDKIYDNCNEVLKLVNGFKKYKRGYKTGA